MKNKDGQEELVGFALIILIVGVIALVFIASGLNKPEQEAVESYEVSSFLQSALQYTTICEDRVGNKSLQEVIVLCEKNDFCGKVNSCEIMNSTIREILKDSWEVGEEYPVKGYDLRIDSETKNLFYESEGTETKDSKGSRQDFAIGKNYVQIYFVVYN